MSFNELARQHLYGIFRYKEAGVPSNKDIEELFIQTSDGWYKMHHNQSCCEHVYLESLVGLTDDAYKSYIAEADEVSNHSEDEDGYDSVTWTFYTIKTTHGDISIRWIGYSSGYYSEEVTFESIPTENVRYDQLELITKDIE